MVKPYDSLILWRKTIQNYSRTSYEAEFGYFGARTQPIISTVLSFCWKKRTTKIAWFHITCEVDKVNGTSLVEAASTLNLRFTWKRSEILVGG